MALKCLISCASGALIKSIMMYLCRTCVSSMQRTTFPKNINFSFFLDCSNECLIYVLTLPAFMCRFHLDKNSLWFVFNTISRMTLFFCILKGKKVAGLSLLFGLQAAPKIKIKKKLNFFSLTFNLVDCFTQG